MKITKQRAINILKIKDISENDYKKALRDINYMYNNRLVGVLTLDSDKKQLHLSGDILGIFTWANSNCGHVFWNKIYNAPVCKEYFKYRRIKLND